MINELQEIKICIGGTVNEKNQKKNCSISSGSINVNRNASSVMAKDRNRGSWGVYSYGPGAQLKYSSVELYYTTDEKYAFKVSSITTGGCYYSYVEIGCPNGNIYMDGNLSKKMSSCGVKTFTVKKTSGTYVNISAELYCDAYGPIYNGLAYIVHN